MKELENINFKTNQQTRAILGWRNWLAVDGILYSPYRKQPWPKNPAKVRCIRESNERGLYAYHSFTKAAWLHYEKLHWSSRR